MRKKLSIEQHQRMRKVQRNLVQLLWKLRVSKYMIMTVSSGPKLVEISWDIMDKVKKGNYDIT